MNCFMSSNLNFDKKTVNATTKITIMDANKDTLYARWLAGDLSPEEEQTLQASGELEELEAIINTADNLALPKYDTTDGFAQFKAKKMPPKTAKVRSLNTRRIWPMIAAAASVLLLIYVGNLLLNSGPESIESGNLANLTHRFVDQTTVVLNDGSKLEYDESNWKQARSVKLKGEALFTVKKGNAFTVNTPNGTVEVLGTSFNVRAWGDKLHVECYEGKVRVRQNNQETILTPNQAVNVVNGQMKEQTITHQKPLWSTGNSRFYEEQLSTVFEELERQYDVKVNRSKIERPFSGNFQHDNLEAALNNICKPMGLKFEIAADGKTIEIKE